MTDSRKGGPPAQVTAAAVLCGLLALPMIATAGSLVAFAVSGAGSSLLSLLLALVVLAVAGVDLMGAVHIVQRGTARLAQLAGYITIGVTALMLVGLMFRPAFGAALVVPVFFLPAPVAMLALLGHRRTRLWLSARHRAYAIASAATQVPARQDR